MLKSGIGVSEGFVLQAEREADPGMKKILEGLEASTASGSSVHAAMAEAGVFPEYMRRMVLLGERTGSLENVLRSLSVYYDRQLGLRRTIRSAVFYPAVLLAIILSVFTVFVMEVLPVFQRVFDQIGAQMMPAARSFLRFGRWLHQYGGFLLILLGLMVVAGLLIGLRPGLRARAAGVWHRFFSGSRLYKKIRDARTANLLALGVAGTANLAEAFELAAEFTSGPEADGRLTACAALLAQGQSLSQAAQETGLFDPVYVRMISLGERGGSVDTALQEVARRSGEEMDVYVSRLIGRIEPAAVAFLSVCVGLLLLSVMLPLVGVMSAL